MATSPAPPVLEYRDVRAELGGRVVLEGVDAVVPGAGITVVVGPSGSGKSTLLRLANRLLAPSSGRVLFRGDDVAGLDPLEHRRRVGMVFQQPVPFGGTVRDNLRVAREAATEAEMRRVLERAHLPAAFLDRPAGELSGGESQRACLARTLLTGPEVLLMDEPTSALDAGARDALERLGRELAGDGVPVVWVTHDAAQCARLADWLIALDAGRVAGMGAPDRVPVVPRAGAEEGPRGG